MSDFNKFDLVPSIHAALKTKGYTLPTPIQTQAIPPLLKGHDLIGIAQTGTGKTAAFALPILDRLARRRVNLRPLCTRVLVLTPTRELAAQVNDSFQAYGRGLPLSHAMIFGGVNQRPQTEKMKRGVDVLVATPGRLLDLIEQGFVRFDQLEVFVLDEVDRMLDMGFINDVKKVIKLLPQGRQTLLFSATMPSDIAKLAQSILRNPIRVEVTPQATTVQAVEQKLHHVERDNKPLLLTQILKKDGVHRALVFTRTKYGADRVVRRLHRSAISAVAIHGNKTQSARETALFGFRSGKTRVLVATDIAARGIDIPDISHVINYDFPNTPETYVHRIGRTARAGKGGVAISFCDASEQSYVKDVERLIKGKIPVDAAHPFHSQLRAPVSRPYPRHRHRYRGKLGFQK